MILSTQSTMMSGNATISPQGNEYAKENSNYNNFIKLLTTELKNQDPLKPLEPTQIVTQLATFSTVEQAIKTNILLSKLVDISSKNQSTSLAGNQLPY